MEQNEEIASFTDNIFTEAAPVSAAEDSLKGGELPSTGEVCPSCGSDMTDPSFVYAIGRIEPRFPKLSVEKEVAQATGRTKNVGKTDHEAFHAVLSTKGNRYLARQLCWVMTVQGLETFILMPRDPVDYDLLLDAIRPTPSPTDLDVVIGMKGALAPPEMCNGLVVPVLIFDQIYSFDRETLFKSIPKPEKLSAERFKPITAELFDRIMQLTDNCGSTDEHRALNYLAMRYPAIYATAVECYSRDYALKEVEVRSSRLSGTRNIMDAIFSYANRNTDVTEQYFVRVDVTDEFPFLVTKMTPYYNR